MVIFYRRTPGIGHYRVVSYDSIPVTPGGSKPGVR
jgi:hypothetical protein